MSRWIWIAAALMLIAGIGVYAFNGQYSRYLADDFCIYNESQGRDAIAKTAEWYGNSGGRVAQYMALVWTLQAGIGFAPLSPALLLLAWVAALTWSLYPFARRWQAKDAGWIAFTAAAALVLAALAGSPQIAQSLYWVTGAYTYTAPLILASLLPGVLLRVRPLFGVPLIVVVTLAAGTFAEPVATWQVAALGLALMFKIASRRKNRTSQPLLHMEGGHFRVLAAGVVGAILAVMILLIAPGNAVRAGSFTASPSIIAALLGSVQYALLYAFALAGRIAPLAMLTLFVVPSLIALARPADAGGDDVQLGRAQPIHLLAWIGAGFVALIAFMVPGLYATSAPPPARSFIIAFFSLAVTLMGAGWLFGRIMRARRGKPISARTAGIGTLIFVGLMVIASAGNELRYTSTFALHAAEWDARAGQLHAAATASESAVQVAAFTVDIAAGMGLDTLNDNPLNWVNQCAAVYYGVESVTVR